MGTIEQLTTHDDVIDYGTAPTTYVNGLIRLDVMGPDCNFALWGWRNTMGEGRVRRVREVIHNVVMPIEAVGPGIELTLVTLGPRLLLPAAGYALRQLMM